MIQEQNYSKLELGILSLSKSLNVMVEPQLSRYRDVKNHYIKYNGPHYTVKRLKSLYQWASRYVLHQPRGQLHLVKTAKDGFPSEIRFIKVLLDGNIISKRLGLTILNQYRDIKVEPDFGTNSITDPPLREDDDLLRGPFSQYEEFLNQKLPRSFILPPPKFGRTWKPHSTSKSGPNGSRQLLRCDEDAVSVSMDDEVFKNLSEFLKYYFQDSSSFYDTFNSMISLAEVKQQSKSGKCSRVSFLKDSGGKTRVIAMGDYWSQSALRPLHDEIMSLLSRLKTDGTYNQSEPSTYLRKASSEGKEIFCYDLSSATDRFPAGIQAFNLCTIYRSEAIGWTWYDLIKGRNFICDKTQKSVRYSVGQPMGLYSSWAVFSVSHHILIQYAAYLVGKKLPFKAYRVLGDDMFMLDRDVARKYEELLSYLGVEISLGKSIVPHSRKYCAGEFAKRIFLNGYEYTPVSPDLLKSVTKDPTLVPMLIDHIVSRGWLEQLHFCSTRPHFISSLISNIGNVTNRGAKGIKSLVYFPISNYRYSEGEYVHDLHHFADPENFWYLCNVDRVKGFTRQIRKEMLLDKFEKIHLSLVGDDPYRVGLPKIGDLHGESADSFGTEVLLESHPLVQCQRNLLDKIDRILDVGDEGLSLGERLLREEYAPDLTMKSYTRLNVERQRVFNRLVHRVEGKYKSSEEPDLSLHANDKARLFGRYMSTSFLDSDDLKELGYDQYVQG